MTKTRRIVGFLCLLVLVLSIFALSSCNEEDGALKLTFVVDGQVYHTEEIKAGDKVTLPNDPVKDGYTFGGWYLDSGAWNNFFDKDAAFTESLEVYAKFTKNGDGEAQHKHNLTHHEAVSATCTDSGSLEYWSCDGCNKKFLDAAATKEALVVTVDSVSHIITYVDAVDATCTAEGTLAHWTCSLCSANYSDEAAENKLDTVSVSKLAHSVAHVDALNSTCDKEGNIEHWYCSMCESCFSDEAASLPLASVSVSKLAHTLAYNAPVAPSCSARGTVEYWSCSECGNIFADSAAANEITVVTIDKLPHTLTHHDAVPATCTEHGTIEYWSCSVCNVNFKDEAAENVAPTVATDTEKHTLSHEKEVAASCTKEGNIEYWTCSVCEQFFIDKNGTNAVITVVTQRLPHTILSHRATEGTCKVPGVGEHYSCEVCKKLFADDLAKVEIEKAPELIGAHKYDEGVCSVCKALQPTEALIFSLINGDTAYAVTGVEASAAAEIAEIVIPDSYLGLPVTAIANDAFKGLTALTKIDVPETVSVIGDNAFSGCTSFATLTLAKNIKLESVGAYAFKDTKIRTFTVTETVTYIGEGAFEGCARLTTFKFDGNSVLEAISAKTLAGTSVEELVIPASVKSIGLGAFADCSKLESIVLPFVGATSGGEENTHFGYIFGAESYEENGEKLPEKLVTVEITDETVIYTNAFNGCSKIKKLTVSDTVEEIGFAAFSGCTVLQDLTLPFAGATVDAVENSHFGYIFGAESYNDNASAIPTSLTKLKLTKAVAIQESAFSGASSLKSVTLPATLKTIARNAFDACISINEVKISGGLETVGENAFRGCSSLAAIVLPDTVTSIGYSAFEGCSALASMTLPFIGDGDAHSHFSYIFGSWFPSSTEANVPAALKTVVVTSESTVADSAFLGCKSIENLTLTAPVLTLGNRAFEGCSSLKALEFSEGSLFETVGTSVFSGCASLKTLVIPTSVKNIASDAFTGCDALESMTLPFVGASLDGKGPTFFAYIFGGTSYADNATVLPATLKTIVITNASEIDANAFAGAANLTSVTISDTVTKIGAGAFAGCSSLESMTLPFAGAERLGEENTFFAYIFGGASYADNATILPATLTDVKITNAFLIADNAFAGATIKNLTIGSEIKAIGVGAFMNCASLETVTFEGESTLLTISENAFAGCTSIKEIVIPDSVNSIGKSAFAGCSALESLTIPFVGAALEGAENDTYFSFIFGGENYEANATAVPETLTNVTITKATAIAPYAFYGSKVTNVTLPAGVTIIGESAFESSSLTSLTLADGSELATVADKAFFGATLLKEIELPKTLHFIGKSAFAGCSALEKVEFAADCELTIVAEEAFSACTSLKSLDIPAAVTTIGKSAFAGCSALESLTIPFVGAALNVAENTYFSYIFGGDSYEANATVVPESLKTVVLTGSEAIAENAFAGVKLEKLTIAASVKTIAKSAFANTALKSVVFADGSELEAIAESAFAGSAALEKLAIPAGVTTIGESAFEGCSALKELTFADGIAIELIAKNTFNGCSQLAEIKIPASVKTISEGAFEACSALAKVSFANGALIETIEAKAFAAAGVKSIEIPSTVTTIALGAFEGATALESITLPYLGNGTDKLYLGYIFGAEDYAANAAFVPATLKEVKVSGGEIVAFAFYGCTSIEKVTLPSVTLIPESLFEGCANLKSFEVGAEVQTIEKNAFKNCASLAAVTFEKNAVIESVGEYAFYGCSSLAGITVPASVTAIGEGAFECSGLKSVSFESGTLISAIADYAFSATPLESFTVPASVVSLGFGVFEDCASIKSITVTFIGNGVDKTHFGYIFGAPTAQDNADYVPASLKTVKVVGGEVIEKDAFAGCAFIEEIVLHSEITAIGENAFAGCSLLKSITVPFVGNGSDKTHFGYIFGAPTCLDNVTYVPATLEAVTVLGDTIAENAFAGCATLKTINISEDVVFIGVNAFVGCAALEYTTYEGAIYLGNATNPYSVLVSVLDKLTKTFELHEDTRVILDGAFAGCAKLRSVVIPADVRMIGDSAFEGCSRLKLLTFAEGSTLNYVGNRAFAGCEFLEVVELPAGVSFIGEAAFEGCSQLATLSVPFVGKTASDRDSAYLGFFFGAPEAKLNAEYVPATLTTLSITSAEFIGDYAFFSCGSLISVTIGDGLVEIGTYAFYKCTSLETVVLPASVERIYLNAFYGCAAITEFTFLGTEQAWEEVYKAASWNASTSFTVTFA